MSHPPPFKAAILVNSISPIDPNFNAAFKHSITTAKPSAQVSFFDPVEAQTYPRPGDYDLIVLTGGGTADATAKDVPWVLKMREFLRTTVETCPGQKIVGVCWGHEVIHVAFGGALGRLGGFEGGVMPIKLTSAGSKFFSSYLPSTEVFNIHEFHEMEVKAPGKGFRALAVDNQCLVNEANTILSFQGHPEMDAELSKLLLSFNPQYVSGDKVEQEALETRIHSPHDGIAIWKRIVEWAGEA
ncbi:copper/iron-regulated glutamine amidotransferase [Periconia macrospinosa]|uniref:Copper/iron-regulated glutamine amidotransferase n=1 Tax=Periconia macrospinosa TaxID=97972 RepID=A0A2V1DGP8_9PLEO|nr:copper/iron-regulated glutamine amidotransferase [Periconia macrospinosa]